MPSTLHIGCCGWSYLSERDFLPLLTQKYTSKLQAYCQLLDSVELNSSFYRIPRRATAERWLRDSRSMNPGFTFTVKVFRGITHITRFQNSTGLFSAMGEIAAALEAPVLLFQSPESFRPTSAAIGAMRAFFAEVTPCPFKMAWEPRGASWNDNPGLIAEICREHGLIHCVDPFRNDPLSFGREEGTAYFRLHGFGDPSMYMYEFSHRELEELRRQLETLPTAVREVYVFFNNITCYRNALSFREMIS
jgi:uncharacterized protein YecE (DUF72 family)